MVKMAVAQSSLRRLLRISDPRSSSSNLNCIIVVLYLKLNMHLSFRCVQRCTNVHFSSNKHLQMTLPVISCVCYHKHVVLTTASVGIFVQCFCVHSHAKCSPSYKEHNKMAWHHLDLGINFISIVIAVLTWRKQVKCVPSYFCSLIV